MLPILVTGVPHNNDGIIVIKNTIPSSWDGRKYDVEISRDQKLMVAEKSVHVGQQVNFLLKHTLHFAVARHVKAGEIINVGEVTSHHTCFDVSKYPTGINVYLTKTPGGGRYLFTAEHKSSNDYY